MRIELRPNANDRDMVEVVTQGRVNINLWCVVQRDMFLQMFDVHRALNDGKTVVVELEEVDE